MLIVIYLTSNFEAKRYTMIDNLKPGIFMADFTGF